MRTTLHLISWLAATLAALPAFAAPEVQAPAVRVTSYLLFDGNCREAMQFYQSLLGGKLEMTSVGDSPMAAAFPPAQRARIVHARLISPALELPASDWLAPGEAPARGNMNALYIEGGTPEATRALFDKLSANGKITTPFAEQPFGWYGRVIDAYGVVWMLHADKK